jgi:hypothetical protein
VVEGEIKNLPCPKCNGISRKIITLGHGGLKTDTNFTWLESASKVLVAPGEKPIESRTAYNRHLKQNGIYEKGGDHKIDGKFSAI